MHYSPKLQEAMAEILGVLKRHDIAAHVILTEPGFSEYLWELSPSWSVVRLGEKFDTLGRGMTFRSKLEDYDGDPERQHRELEASVNMIVHFSQLLERDAAIADAIKQCLKKHVTFEEDPNGGVHTPYRPT